MTQIPPDMLPSRALGWVPDPTDDRDDSAMRVLRAVAVPPRASNVDLVQIIDQGQLGSCTANAVAQAVRAAEIIEQVEARSAGTSEVAAALLACAATPFMSRLFVYYLARAYEKTQHEDSGTYIRLIFQTINKYGFPPEHVWPYVDARSLGAPFARMPSAEAFKDAYDQRSSIDNVSDKLVSYSRVMGSGSVRTNAIKLALSERYLVPFGTPVTEDFCNGIDTDKPIDKPRPDQKIAGGHAMCLVGYDGDLFTVANSWGTSFGKGGFVTFTREYIEWAQSNDFWIVKRSPLYRGA